MSEFAHTHVYSVLDCYNCHVQFAITDEMVERLRISGESFYCPNGHRQAFVKSRLVKANEKAQRLEDQVARLNAEKDQLDACCTREKRRRWGLMGHVAKLKRAES